MKTTLTRVIRFSAAHRYWRPEWSEEKNHQVFGACANPHGHGHNYTLEVTVEGEPDPVTGFVIDLGALDRIMKEEVLDKLDHQHLNYAIEEFGEGRKVPTTENIVAHIWNQIEPRIAGVGAGLARLRLREDVDLWSDYGDAP